VAELRYRAYDETRYTWGTTPTTYRYTGQRQEEGLGLYQMGARWVDPALSRWLSADTRVPEPGKPQAFNRYSYVLGNPLVYVDPSGHDLMIVPGYNNDDWLNPEEWKEWIMAYKGWTGEEWNQFLAKWTKADDAGKQQLMQATGVHIFNWAGFATGIDPQAASRSAGVGDMLAELSRQMAGMKDITLVGHSKGGNLVLNYVQQMAERGYVQPKNAVLVDALLQPALINYGPYGGMAPEREWGYATVTGKDATVLNLYNPLDPANDFKAGIVVGAKNIEALSLDVHSVKPTFAGRVLNGELGVQYDHGASKWPYLPMVWK